MLTNHREYWLTCICFHLSLSELVLKMALMYLQQYGSTSESEKELEDTVDSIPDRKRKKQTAALEARRIKRSRHTVVPGNCSTCPLDCGSKIDRETRLRINEAYWDKSPADQKSFIRECVLQIEIKRRRIRSDEHRKCYSYRYHLQDSSFCLQNVCGAFFLNTIGYDRSCRYDFHFQYLCLYLLFICIFFTVTLSLAHSRQEYRVTG